MLRRFIRILLLWVSLGLLPAYADCTTPGMFQAPCNDVSIAILNEIFGSVTDGTAYDTVVGAIFAIMNQIALGVGIILVLYSVITGTVHISHSGELLKERAGLMFPFRLISGITLLLPKANGFCIAQLMVYWMITSGVGAADSVWSAALTYLQSNSIWTTSTASTSSLS